MKKITIAILFLCSIWSAKSYSQCTPTNNGFHIWNGTYHEPSNTQVPYIGYMCSAHDTLIADTTGGSGGWQFYYGDGYELKLIAGSNVVINVYDQSVTSSPVGLTINDSAQLIINGAHTSPVMNPSLSFTAPYTGIYYIVFDSAGVCGTDGSSPIGSLIITLSNASSVVCPALPANDTICGAINMILNTVYSGNTADAMVTDPRDNDVNVAGYNCSLPNNTLWYSYTASVNDTFYLTFNSPGTPEGLDGWVGWFDASNCNGALTYHNCLQGAAQGITIIDTIVLAAGVHNYFMIDGFNGAFGKFDFKITQAQHSAPNGINHINNDNGITISPNPASSYFKINFQNNTVSNAAVMIIDITGRKVMEKKIEGNNSTIDISSLESGSYFIKITENNKSIYLNKLIK